MFVRKLIKIKGKQFENLTVSEVAQMILADSSISPSGSDLFDSAALDEFLYCGRNYPPELERIRSEILHGIYIDVPAQKAKRIDVNFLKQYSTILSKRQSVLGE